MVWARACSLIAACFALAACGRIDFDLVTDGGSDAGGADAAVDAAISGLVVWFPLDDCQEPFADIVSGQPGHCSPATCPTPTAGHLGGACLFDGVANCIHITDTGQLDPPELTLSIWARQDREPNSFFSQVAKLVETGSVDSLDSWQIENSNLDLLFFTTNHGGTGNSQIISAAPAIIVGQWQHLATTWDGTTKRLYVDGTLIAVTGMATGLPALAYDHHDATIGCDDQGVGDQELYGGALDDFRLYDRALSAAEIQMLASQ